MVLPWEQRFGVGGKTLQSMKAASARVRVRGALWLCLTAVRGVTAGNIGEPLRALIYLACTFDSSENVAAGFSLKGWRPLSRRLD